MFINFQGVPIRVELGPKDMSKGTVVAVRRVASDKLSIPRAEAPKKLLELLEITHDEMLAKYVIFYHTFSLVISNGFLYQILKQRVWGILGQARTVCQSSKPKYPHKPICSIISNCASFAINQI